LLSSDAHGSRSAVALLFAATLAMGCGNATNSTTGKRVTFATKVTFESASDAEFDTAFGWHVKVDKAAVAVGGLYYFDGEPAFVQNDPRRRGPLEHLASWFEGTAYAHPGHYQSGDALGEMLQPGSVDLFATPVALGAGDGISGTYRSARFAFAQKIVGKAASELDGHVAFAEGTASKPGDGGTGEIHFRIAADYDDVAAKVTEGQVDGCEFKETQIANDGTVVLSLKPGIWFDLVDFTKVDPGTSAAPTEIPKGDIAQIGFALGLVQLTAYDFSFSK
jgi:hypothetical protein